MKILLVHNFYRTGAPGGEDAVFHQERDLLLGAGHEVVCYTRSNDEMDETSSADRLRVVWGMQRSDRTFNELRDLIRRTRPDVAHFHNTFPLISASGYEACVAEDVPVVQTVHNFRIVCASATHFRAGSACEQCVPGNPWPAVRHGCYRGSRVASVAVSTMLFRNYRSGVYHDRVSTFIALTQFAARKLVAFGIPTRRIAVKPNFVELPSVRDEQFVRGEKFVFVGRLAEEKGVTFLLEAWRTLPDVPLLIVGDGPLRDSLREFAQRHSLRVEFTGLLERIALAGVLRSARSVIVPSLCLEGGVPLTLLEAMAAGAPVAATRIGGIPELLTQEVDGLLFDPGNADQLTVAVRRLNEDSDLRSSLARSAMQTVNRVHARHSNLDALVRIYRSVCKPQTGAPRD
jgi:glycosyltransferase involved in cell wall biosynthesis